MTFFVGLIIGIGVGILLALVTLDLGEIRAFRKTSVEVDLDQCCKNAYDSGFIAGRAQGQQDILEKRGIL